MSQVGQVKRADASDPSDSKEAIRKVLQAGLIGAGAGATLGGIRGLYRLATAKNTVNGLRKTRPAVVDINTGPDDSVKSAGDEDASLSATVNNIKPTAVSAPEPSSDNWWDWYWGKGSKEPFAKPYFMTAALGAGALGLYGGYKGMSALSEWKHKSDRDASLSRAKKEYRDALLSQYGSKTASVNDELVKELDELAHEKVALSLGETANAGAGTYFALASALAAGAGIGTYAYTKSQQPEERVAKAIRQRERMRWMARPPEIYAVANRKPQALKDEETEDDIPSSINTSTKVAALYRAAATNIA